MKQCLSALAMLMLFTAASFAGTNAGGVIFVHNAGIADNNQDMCGQGDVPPICEAANTELDNFDATPMVWKVYAAFRPCSAPRLKALAFGITYSDYTQGGTVVLTGEGNCHDPMDPPLEFPYNGWPASGGGEIMLWGDTHTTTLTEVCWFAGYSYPFGAPSTFDLGPHPDPEIGGVFADDSTPPQLDPIYGYGSLGFNQPGWVTCPRPDAPGACCVDDVCTLTCAGFCSGDFLGSGVPCEPNPCPLPQTGACCINSVCYVMNMQDCQAQGGTYGGDGTSCDGYVCQPALMGACCVGFDCFIEIPDICHELGGTYYGDGSSCFPSPCPPPVPVKESTWGRIKLQYR